MNTKELEKILYLIVIVAIVGALFNIPSFLTNLAIQWLISSFIGSVFSLIAGTLVEAVTGDFLKTISFTVEIKGFHFSITAFALTTFIVKVWLFGF